VGGENIDNQFRWLPSFRDLDENQREVIFKSLEKENHLIFGPAGCGKTAITLYCAKTLQDTGKKYLILVYTKVLMNFISSAANDLNIPQENITTFYSWVWRHLPSEIQDKEYNDEDKFNRWVDDLLFHYKKYPKLIPNYDYVLIDEAQDFNPNVSKLLHLISNNLFIAGDTAQSLYTGIFNNERLIGMWQPLSSQSELVFNYRNPKAVAKVAALFVDNTSYDAEKFLSLVKGKNFEMKPILYYVDSPNKQTAIITDLIEQTRGSERLGILFKTNSEVDSMANLLRNEGIEFQIASGRNNGNYNFLTTKPTLATIHSAKGLEFDWVVLPNLTPVVWDKYQNDPNDRRLFFVALTRTKNRLYLITQNNFESSFVKEILDKDLSLLQVPKKQTQKSSDSSSDFDDLPF